MVSAVVYFILLLIFFFKNSLFLDICFYVDKRKKQANKKCCCWGIKTNPRLKLLPPYMQNVLRPPAYNNYLRHCTLSRFSAKMVSLWCKTIYDMKLITATSKRTAAMPSLSDVLTRALLCFIHACVSSMLISPIYMMPVVLQKVNHQTNWKHFFGSSNRFLITHIFLRNLKR